MHPELTGFDAYFAPMSPAAQADAAARMANGDGFLRGSYAHHWHNRYDLGIPNGTWAGIAFAHHSALAAVKPCERGPPGSRVGVAPGDEDEVVDFPRLPTWDGRHRGVRNVRRR